MRTRTCQSTLVRMAAGLGSPLKNRNRGGSKASEAHNENSGGGAGRRGAPHAHLRL